MIICLETDQMAKLDIKAHDKLIWNIEPKKAWEYNCNAEISEILSYP